MTYYCMRITWILRGTLPWLCFSREKKDLSPIYKSSFQEGQPAQNIENVPITIF